jgi:peptidoglycan hydrolase CwlO-like protein
MKSRIFIQFTIVALLSCLLFTTVRVSADEIDDIQKEISKLQELVTLSESANKTNENNYKKLASQISSIQFNIKKLDKEVKLKDEELQKQEESLIQTKEGLAALSKALYTSVSKKDNPFISFLTLDFTSASGTTYAAKTLGDQKQILLSASKQIEDLSENKKAIAIKKQQLKVLTESLNKDANFLSQEIDKAKSFAKESDKKIRELSQKQQAILSARSGSTVTSAVNISSGSDIKATIAFKPQAPRNSFAAFSFGAYSHRKGMSQYGAKGRANKGQSYKDILKFYYGKEPVNADTGGNLKVDGHGELEFENKYLMGIAEMPSSFPKEALKAQAVAARTYAYRYKKDNKSICTTEACQVFNKSKSDNVPSEWKSAVEETKGQILEDVVTYYSSTTGGYINGIGWDTDGGVSSGDWASKSYEVYAESPWFYRSWYRKGYSDSGDSCGRSSPWLSMEEFSDIINVWIARSSDIDIDENKILPITITNCSIGGSTGPSYSMSEVRELASRAGGAVESISGVRVENNNTGATTQVILQTNRGEIKISGSEFKQVFNLRAPGYLSIPQTGFTFFNIENTL